MPGPQQYFFFFNDTATTEIYTLSLHDALPIFALADFAVGRSRLGFALRRFETKLQRLWPWRSEEHTSELQSRLHLVCRLLLEKKKNTVSLSNGTTRAPVTAAPTLEWQLLVTLS